MIVYIKNQNKVNTYQNFLSISTKDVGVSFVYTICNMKNIYIICIDTLLSFTKSDLERNGDLHDCLMWKVEWKQKQILFYIVHFQLRIEIPSFTNLFTYTIIHLQISKSINEIRFMRGDSCIWNLVDFFITELHPLLSDIQNTIVYYTRWSAFANKSKQVIYLHTLPTR